MPLAEIPVRSLDGNPAEEIEKSDRRDRVEALIRNLPELVDAVGLHHTVTESSDPLNCLLNLSKDLGLGYMEEEKGVYLDPLLANLEISLRSCTANTELFPQAGLGV